MRKIIEFPVAPRRVDSACNNLRQELVGRQQRCTVSMARRKTLSAAGRSFAEALVRPVSNSSAAGVRCLTFKPSIKAHFGGRKVLAVQVECEQARECLDRVTVDGEGALKRGSCARDVVAAGRENAVLDVNCGDVRRLFNQRSEFALAGRTPGPSAGRARPRFSRREWTPCSSIALSSARSAAPEFPLFGGDLNRRELNCAAVAEGFCWSTARNAAFAPAGVTACYVATRPSVNCAAIDVGSASTAALTIGRGLFATTFVEQQLPLEQQRRRILRIGGEHLFNQSKRLCRLACGGISGARRCLAPATRDHGPAAREARRLGRFVWSRRSPRPT